MPPLPDMAGREVSAGVPVGVTDAQVAVLLRQAQWALDEAAHEFPAGRATPGGRAELAATLEMLALVLRASVSESAGRPGEAVADQRWVFVDCGASAPLEGGGGRGAARG